MTDWDLSVKELRMTPAGEVDSAARLAKMREFERAIAKLRGKVTTMYDARMSGATAVLNHKSTRPG